MEAPATAGTSSPGSTGSTSGPGTVSAARLRHRVYGHLLVNVQPGSRLLSTLTMSGPRHGAEDGFGLNEDLEELEDGIGCLLSGALSAPPDTGGRRFTCQGPPAEEEEGGLAPPKEPRTETSKGLSHSGETGGSSAGPPVPPGTGPVSPSPGKKTGTIGVPVPLPDPEVPPPDQELSWLLACKRHRV
ncbi:uncharacterized protein LOC135202849 [Macrobrachium nipponense]|uniref:uncharacterized protein LOC135202849 n=1 Tax=Macrobrachium nipponense TaxID=159736 RepID=UPI0030C82235